MCDMILQENPVPNARSHGFQVQETFLLDFSDIFKESIIIVCRFAWADHVSPSIHKPLVERSMELIFLESWNDGSFQEGSYEKIEKIDLNWILTKPRP